MMSGECTVVTPVEPCRRRQEASRGHLRWHRLSFLAATAFFRPGGYALFAKTPTVDLPLRRRLGRSLSRPPSCAPFQPHRQAHDCPATPLSPSGVFFQPHIFAGLRSSFFRCTVSSRQRAGGVLGISSSPCCCSMRPSSGRAARRATAVSTPLPGPTAARLLLRATSSGRATHLYLAWPHRDELSTSTLPGLVNLSTRPHT